MAWKDLEPRRKRNRIGAAALALVLLGAGAWWIARPSADAGPRAPSASIFRRSAVHVPDSVRIKVQVLNATASRGLARRAMRQLRDAGFDVVEIGTVPSAQRVDTTLVLDRSGHAAWAQLVAVALGGGTVQSRPDSSRYLDVTVLLGATYRPPAETLYP